MRAIWVVAVAVHARADESGLPSLASLKVDTWHALTPSKSSGAHCMFGAPYSFFVVPREGATKVVVEFLGGGACWSAETCDDALRSESPVLPISRVPSALVQRDGEKAADVAAQAKFVGIDFIFDDPGFSDATYVLATYCTQDVHLGQNTAIYRDDLIVDHNGWANARAVLGWVEREFGGNSDVVVTGCSAGGIATPVMAKSLVQSFSKISVISDSFVGLASDNFTAEYLQNWGAECVFAEVLGAFEMRNGIEMTEHLWRRILAPSSSNVVVGAYTAVHDRTQMAFLRDMRGVLESARDPRDQARFARLTLSLLDRLREDYPETFSTFIVQGDSHCGVALDTAKKHAGFQDWARLLLENELPPSVACADCDLAEIAGCDGIVGSKLVEAHCMSCNDDCADATNPKLFETCPDLRATAAPSNALATAASPSSPAPTPAPTSGSSGSSSDSARPQRAPFFAVAMFAASTALLVL
ncbi:hypothetical protein M885DRAFT_614159 [Pelagophyceae sp. CCMP2097]|nr:hypothetical protein M885DRAFT_614159 [Pelagophyceae sp. CCMP2097]